MALRHRAKLAAHATTKINIRAAWNRKKEKKLREKHLNEKIKLMAVEIKGCLLFHPITQICADHHS